MHCTFAHHLLASVQPVPRQWPVPPGQLLPVCTLGTWHGISLWPAQVRCPGHAPSQPSALPRWQSMGKQKSLTQGKLCLTTIKTSLSYQHYSHSEFKTQQCTKMKINPIASKNGTSSWIFFFPKRTLRILDWSQQAHSCHLTSYKNLGQVIYPFLEKKTSQTVYVGKEFGKTRFSGIVNWASAGLH